MKALDVAVPLSFRCEACKQAQAYHLDFVGDYFSGRPFECGLCDHPINGQRRAPSILSARVQIVLERLSWRRTSQSVRVTTGYGKSLASGSQSSSSRIWTLSMRSGVPTPRGAATNRETNTSGMARPAL
jgi:hypothetical protein